jgi:predicted naringenin-chalcone synthase
MVVAITSIGTAVPDYKRHQLETVDLIADGVKLTAAERRLLKSIYKATGIQYRYSVLKDYSKNVGEFEFFPNDPDSPFPSTAERMAIYKDNALTLALRAIDNCLSHLAFDYALITHVITVSCTGMYAPGIDIEIIQKLNLHPSTKRTAINFMGCYGAFNAMKVADAICKADSSATVLIVCVELCTIHFQKKMTLDHMISNAIFADGAGAVLIQANPTVNKYFSLSAFFCDLLPQASHAMAWHIADNGFDIVLSSYVPEAIESGIEAFTKKLFNQQQLSLSDIDFFAIHPGGLKILEACETALSLQKAHNQYAYEVLQNYGNMSSATVLFVLKAIWDAISQRDHQKTIFSCAFGPGLTLESMLLETHLT